MWRASAVARSGIAADLGPNSPGRVGAAGEADAPAQPVALTRPVAAAQPVAPTKPGAPAKGPIDRLPGMRAADREFLPAAIEILETPPSPISTTLLWFICLAAAATLAWSYFGRLDIHAVAPGRIQPNGRSKVVQPLESGKVAAVHVSNGSLVEAGDVLIELDATEAFAEREAQARELEAVRAEIVRLRAAIESARTSVTGPVLVEYPLGTNEILRLREQRVLIAELAELASNRASLDAQLAEKAATKDRLVASIAARENLLALSRERVQMRETLSTRGAGSRALIIEAQQQLETQLQADVADRRQVVETEAAMRSIDRRTEELISRFIAERAQKLAEAERKQDRLVQELVKVKSKHERTQLKAPIAGTVQQLMVTTIGQVVTTGQPLMAVVPHEGQIEVEALLLNKDIGFVENGQPAIIKVEAFPFTRYGTIDGVVHHVSRDGVDQRDATTLGDAVAVTKPQGAGGGSGLQNQQSLVFPATIKVSRHAMTIEGKKVPLLPGMAVTVEIKTGQRRAIDYLLSPIQTVISQSAHER